MKSEVGLKSNENHINIFIPSYCEFIMMILYDQNLAIKFICHKMVLKLHRKLVSYTKTL